MNKWRISLFLVVALALACGSAWAQTKVPKSTIIGSEHDLRSALGGASFTACSFCHIAHKVDPVTAPASTGPLLWNHELSSKGTYGTYTSASFAGYGTDIADLGGQNTVSNLCLSCHDGTVAVNQFYVDITNSTFTGTVPEGTVYTTHQISNLAQTHPVNFTYNAALATAAGMLVPANANSVDGGGLVPLYTGKMQCATCHDPHNGGSGIFSRPFPTQSSGTFCTYCHL